MKLRRVGHYGKTNNFTNFLLIHCTTIQFVKFPETFHQNQSQKNLLLYIVLVLKYKVLFKNLFIAANQHFYQEIQIPIGTPNLSKYF